jgi:hypothetical protein
VRKRGSAQTEGGSEKEGVCLQRQREELRKRGSQSLSMRLREEVRKRGKTGGGVGERR